MNWMNLGWRRWELIEDDQVVARFGLRGDWVRAEVWSDGAWVVHLIEAAESDEQIKKRVEGLLDSHRCCPSQCLHHCKSVGGSDLLCKVWCCKCACIFESKEPIKLKPEKIHHLLDFYPRFARWT